jgi:hypothetical protein
VKTYRRSYKSFGAKQEVIIAKELVDPFRLMGDFDLA